MENITKVVKTTEQLTPQEVVDIMKERVKVFVVEQKCPYQEVDDKDNNATHVYLFTK